MKFLKTLAVLLAITFSFPALAWTWGTPSAASKEAQMNEILVNQALSEVGMPALKNFSERRLAKMLYEKRDDPNYRTYAYIIDYGGILHTLCDAVGFGLPYGAQFSAPSRVAKFNETPERGNVLVPQAEPNGLFPPASSDLMWIMCLDPNDKEIKPILMRANWIVSPFKLR